MNLLPPNATALERDLLPPMLAAIDIPVEFDRLWDAQRCPIGQLPWLAWARSTDAWNPDWTEAQKRQAVASSYYVHKHKGTAAAVKSALGAMGYHTQVVEWFAQTPPAAPYTFKIDIEISDQGITEAVYLNAERLAIASKNARSHLAAVRAVARTDCRIHVGVAATCGEVVVVQPYSLTLIEAHTLARVGTAASSVETTSVYPEGSP